jgi:DHA2 family multidrug resistance protein
MVSAQDVANRVPITAALMLSAVMNTLDTTIANVALPHMQGSFSATQDQMTWVLTSYIVATAVMTPLTGWLAGRFGRRFVFCVSIAGFTAASMMCGGATSLAQIVLFRVIQGVCGAALSPLSQAVMLDLYPPSMYGQVMAIWGAGLLMGPIFGPVIGGWLTDNLSWRWVFYINLPVGLLSFAGVWFLMSKDRGERGRPFDFLGFGAIALFVACLQLALDRGPTLDWFGSPEIWVEVILGGVGLYIFTVQTLTAHRPFFDRSLALDRNFVTSNFFSVVVGIVLFSTMALQPPILQGLLGYPVFGAGLVMMPRGVGSLVSMYVVGRLVGRVDTRLLLLFGLGVCAWSLEMMSHFDLSMTGDPMAVSGFVQGFGLGFMWVPVSAVAFATLDPRLRSEAATVYALIRNLGQSAGLSIMEALYTHQAAQAHADLAAGVQPSSPTFAAGVGALNSAMGGVAGINGEVTRQASMVGYIDVFRLMFLGSLAVMPLALILRPAKKAVALAEVAVE